MINFHFIDLAVMGLYVFSIIYLGIYRNKKEHASEANFILSGRRLSLPGFVATLVTTWYGAILGIGENTLLYGIQTWFIFSFPYYVFALAYALWVAPRIRESSSISIPDQFRKRYGEEAGIVSALILSFLASPAPYILSMGSIIQFMFDVELGMGLMIATLFSVLYVWNGGFGAVVRTDLLQFGLMFGGFILLLSFLWIDVKDPITMLSLLPEKYLNPLGGNSLQYILAWFFIAAWTFIDPGFFQRCAAAKSPTTARNGVLTAIIFWAIFDCLTITCALYAIGTLPESDATLTFPMLAMNILPIGLFGLFMTGIIATLMSTIDSLSLVSAISFGRDILWRLEGSKKQEDIVAYIRRGLIAMSFLSLILAYLLPSIVQLFYVLGSVLIPGLIIPFLNTLRKESKKINSSNGIRWMVLPTSISIMWYAISSLTGEPLLGLEPFYPGMAVSIIYFLWFEFGDIHGN